MAQSLALSQAELVVRPAREDDLEQILAIEERSFPTPWSRAALRGYLGESGFIVCEYKDQIVGYTLVSLRTPSLFERLERLTLDLLRGPSPSPKEAETESVGHLMNLAVHPDFRGLGLGRLLMAKALEHLRRLGALRVDLEVRVGNRRALKLYESFGFGIRRLIRGYYQNGDDAYLMSREL